MTSGECFEIKWFYMKYIKTRTEPHLIIMDKVI